VITEPTIDPEHLTALQALAEESQRRNSTNSIRLVSKIQSYKFTIPKIASCIWFQSLITSALLSLIEQQNVTFHS